MVVLQCNGKTYGNAYLITFKVGFLHAQTHAHAHIQFLLEFSRVGHHIHFDVLHSCETCPLEAHHQSREEPKVTWSEIHRVRWLGDHMNVFLSEELLHNKQCVAQAITVMQKSLSLLFVVLLPPNCITQPLQNCLKLHDGHSSIRSNILQSFLWFWISKACS
jgi:hypothetical protein